MTFRSIFAGENDFIATAKELQLDCNQAALRLHRDCTLRTLETETATASGMRSTAGATQPLNIPMSNNFVAVANAICISWELARRYYGQMIRRVRLDIPVLSDTVSTANDAG